MNSLGVGHLTTKKNEVQIVVNSLPQIKQKILPLSLKKHLTDEGLQQIIDLAYNMNKEDKGRRLTKEEFIQKMKAKSSPKKGFL